MCMQILGADVPDQRETSSMLNDNVRWRGTARRHSGRPRQGLYLDDARQRGAVVQLSTWRKGERP